MKNTDIRAGYASLGDDINKRPMGSQEDQETQEGIMSEKLPELALEMDDEKILKLTKKWKEKWKNSDVKSEWEEQCKENEKYWKGEHYSGPKSDKKRAMVDNLMFESVETYLPQATRRNPEPLTTLDPSEESTPEKEAYIQRLKKKLASVADKIKLRLKLKRAGKNWALYLLGVAKFGWDIDRNIPAVSIIRPQKLIMDPEATVDEDGYTGSYIGEYRKTEASILIRMAETADKEAEGLKKLKEKIGEDTGTEVQYIEWWTQEYLCWEYEGSILLKRKNPNWNYDKTEEGTSVDDYGNEIPTSNEIKGINHFPSPKMPYEFLSVYNLGTRPVDDTSLIGQNLANQDLVNKRNKQITKNVDGMNGGVVVSEERSGLSSSQAKAVTKALENGGAIMIPTGLPQEAIYRMPSVPLPPDVYNQLQDTRNRLRDIFGTRGSTPAGTQSETTVRGKIISRTQDTDRIGGGVSEYFEQFADGIYNWMVQLLYVYDPEFQPVPGKEPPKVDVSVKEGSLLPKDSTSMANQAIELASAGKMSLVDLFKRLEYPNPEELAANVWLEANAPELLYKNNPLVQEAIQMKQAQAQAAAQAKAEAEMAKAAAGHQNEMQKEQFKAQLKAKGDIVDEAAGAALNNVPPGM
jgi:hypothetical protein